MGKDWGKEAHTIGDSKALEGFISTQEGNMITPLFMIAFIAWLIHLFYALMYSISSHTWPAKVHVSRARSRLCTWKLIFLSSGGYKFEVSAGLVSGDSVLAGLSMASFSLCLHWGVSLLGPFVSSSSYRNICPVRSWLHFHGLIQPESPP